MNTNCLTKRAGVVLSGLVFLGLAVPSANASPSRDYYKVGVVTSLSGQMVRGGNVTRRGYDLWAETVNKQGGIEVAGHKYKVRLIYADGQSNPQSTADAAQRMITRDHVDFILGPYASGTTLGAAPITERYKVPMITGSAESPTIWTHHFKYTFGTIPSVDHTAGKIVETVVNQNPSAKTIAIFGINDPFSKSTAEAYRTEAKKLGLKILSYDVVPTDADPQPLVIKARSEKPDILAISGEISNNINAINSMKSINYSPNALLMHYGVNTNSFLKATGKWSNYVIGATLWSPKTPYKGQLFGTAQDYYKTAQIRYGSAPDYTEAASSAAGEAFAAALKEAKLTPPLTTAKREKLMKALEKINIMTFYGPIAFDTSGKWYHDNTKLNPLVIQMINGKAVIVGPGKLGNQKVVYPRPKP